jgi:hypothetical protein
VEKDERIAMWLRIIRIVVIVVVFELVAIPLRLFVLKSWDLPFPVHFAVAFIAFLVGSIAELHRLRREKEAAEKNEATSTLAVSFKAALSLGQLLEAVHTVRGYTWTEGQKAALGRYIRGIRKEATVTVLCYESRYLLEMEFPLDGPVKPAHRAEVFAAVCQELLPLMQAHKVREEPAADGARG